MPTPDFILDLRARIGHAPLWLPGVTAVVLRAGIGGRGGAGEDGPDRGGGTEVLLVRRSDNGAWTAVGGILDPDEPVAECAVREVAEETGVVCAVERLVAVRTTGPTQYPNGDVVSFLDHTLRCRYVSGTARVGDDESSEVGWYRVDDLPPMSAPQRARIAAALENPADVLLGRWPDRDP